MQEKTALKLGEKSGKDGQFLHMNIRAWLVLDKTHPGGLDSSLMSSAVQVGWGDHCCVQKLVHRQSRHLFHTRDACCPANHCCLSPSGEDRKGEGVHPSEQAGERLSHC